VQSLCADEFETHFAKLARVRGAQRSRANHRVARLADTRRFDLDTDIRRSGPVVLQITLDP
jgi:hypothetical protein